MATLGSLKKVNLRIAWNHEAFDFTRWLIQIENLQFLSDEIGIEISPIEAEAKAGRFSVDILAEEESTGKKIIIENQLEKSDHDHLGKIITYASGYDAEYVVWIVKEANEEHRQALEWLNDHTDSELNFFLIRLELWQIDDSNPAVKLNTIVKPNEWTKTLRERTKSDELTDTKLMQLEFWSEFRSFCSENNSTIATQKEDARNWYNISIGRSDSRVACTVNTRENEIGCELYIRDNKELFDELYENKDEIEARLGVKPDWQRLDDKKASRIKISRDAVLEHEEEWADYHEWLLSKATTFRQVFGT